MPRPILALILGLAAVSAHAEPPAQPQYKLIKWPEIEVRSGPSNNFDVTMILRTNARVFVKKLANAQGFIEIMPPPGSISWIRKAVVTKFGEPTREGKQAFSVTGDATDPPVPVVPGGTDISKGPLANAQRLDVPRGTQGYLRGQAVKSLSDGLEWYPIDPLPGESRFILAKALEAPTKDDIAAMRPSTDGKLMSIPGRDVNGLYKQAQEADRAGRIDEAIDLYQQVGIEMSKPSGDFNVANFCATRVSELRRRRSVVNGALTSRTNDGKDPAQPPLQNGGGSFNPPRLGGPGNPANPAPANNLRSTGVGYLRRAGFQIDNKPTYALLDRKHEVAFYVTPEPGLNMEPYIEHWVELHGVPEVRGDVRGGAQYMRVGRLYLVK